MAKGYALADPQGNGVFMLHTSILGRRTGTATSPSRWQVPGVGGRSGLPARRQGRGPQDVGAEGFGLHQEARTPLDRLGPAPESRAILDRGLDLHAHAVLGRPVKKALCDAAAK